MKKLFDDQLGNNYEFNFLIQLVEIKLITVLLYIFLEILVLSNIHMITRVI